MRTKELEHWTSMVDRSAKSVRSSTCTRDEAIRQMHACGASLRSIAKVACLSHAAIDKIVKRG